MSTGLRKFVAITGGVLIAAAIAYYPWSFRDDIPVGADTFYWMTAILWAPTALIIGIGAGAWFVHSRWPRTPRWAKPARPDGPRPPSSFKA